MLSNLSQWIREEAFAFGIPLVKLTAEQAQSNGRGICQHRDLGQWGGGHIDCGRDFPIDKVINDAKGTVTPTPPEEPDVKAAPCTFITRGKQQAFMVGATGQMIHWYQGDAQHPWIKEGLSSGWDSDSDIHHDTSPGGADQVWARRANGDAAQIYWSGTTWVTQTLS
jgi:hypothetical protein